MFRNEYGKNNQIEAVDSISEIPSHTNAQTQHQKIMGEKKPKIITPTFEIRRLICTN